MLRIIAIVEGKTEQDFIRSVLAPHLLDSHVVLTATRIGKPGHKGGIGEYTRGKEHCVGLLKQDASQYVTTMLDFYGMPKSWPGRADADQAIGSETKAKTVEAALLADIVQETGSSITPGRFIPYVQLHEFEAILFSDPARVGEKLGTAVTASLTAVRDQFATPEEINDSKDTAPSKRLEAACKSQGIKYNKAVHGPEIAGMITLPVIREQCPHFNDWVTRLEQLGAAPPACTSQPAPGS
jgi:hypothetical protein